MTQSLTDTDALEQAAARVDAALAALAKLEPAAQAVASEVKQAIEAFHKLALTTIVRHLKQDPRGKELLLELVEDPAVYALLLMHNIVRADPLTRARRVLDNARPYMQSHGGDAELVDVRDGVAYIRLYGSCNGCSLAGFTLRKHVEETLLREVPEITRLEVIDDQPAPAILRPEAYEQPAIEKGWVRGPTVAEVPPGRMVHIATERGQVLIINLANRLSAYRNACAHQGRPLDGGILDVTAGTLTCPWHGFCFDVTSGECLTAPQAQLEPFPLRVVDGVIWVRPQ
ncbi:NifU family protein [Chloroflexus sp.]|uniref:NifU family protein n=1 Tax=Chloroflexus sp. TaxID=1904827 RepID=UPI00263032CC|nr:NifU family protein [uncultured Chloroflexus sp.]